MTQPARAEQALRDAVERQAKQREVATEAARATTRASETGVEAPDSDQEKQ